MELRPRQVTLVLCRDDGGVLGQLGPFEVESPWWMEAAPIVVACTDLHGVRPTILRLLDAESEPHGGAVTYLAEVDAAPPTATAWSGSLVDHPLRVSWARPGGPDADLRWADVQLGRLGRPRIAAAVQDRTWNLSSVWRLPTADGLVWLKAVPSFFAHETAVITALADLEVPRLLAGKPGLALLDHIDGTDGYTVGAPGWRTFTGTLVGLQLAAADRTAELLAAGVPRRSLGDLVLAIDALVRRRESELPAAALDRLGVVLADADQAIDQVSELGPGESLVHGDAHPGNGRFHADGVTVLDWGDSFLGQPLLDLAVAESYSPEIGTQVVGAWLAQWEAAGHARASEAWAALRPIARLREAVVFQEFADSIEPDERRYHVGDVVPALLRAAQT